MKNYNILKCHFWHKDKPKHLMKYSKFNNLELIKQQFVNLCITCIIWIMNKVLKKTLNFSVTGQSPEEHQTEAENNLKVVQVCLFLRLQTRWPRRQGRCWLRSPSRRAPVWAWPCPPPCSAASRSSSSTRSSPPASQTGTGASRSSRHQRQDSFCFCRDSFHLKRCALLRLMENKTWPRSRGLIFKLLSVFGEMRCLDLLQTFLHFWKTP